ncbi:MAG: DNA-3-methyladenine glycosylase I [Candidatus Syntrophosphaera sp.]|nr:DNA-3-methyladenine glycosylase I [Candidatus Syntrophosphaera sp.]
MTRELSRCPWVGSSEAMVRYHDGEWGVPIRDDRKLFEYMTLDAFQAGLSWSCVLNKRENFRLALDNFEAARIARYDEQKVQSLLADAGIIRNKLKIRATITNAQAFLEIQREFGSFDTYIWHFVGGQTIVNQWIETGQVPVSSPESDAMSRDLAKRGFKFAGTTICYAFMQGAGMVNDHLLSCFRHSQVSFPGR